MEHCFFVSCERSFLFSKGDENAHQIICEIRTMVQSVVQKDAIKLSGGNTTRTLLGLLTLSTGWYGKYQATFDLLEASSSLSCLAYPLAT